jgi:hypothetical protein
VPIKRSGRASCPGRRSRALGRRSATSSANCSGFYRNSACRSIGFRSKDFSRGRARLTPSSYLTVAERAFSGLTALRPEQDWAWLRQANRTLRTAQVRPKPGPSGARPSRSRFALRPSDWPEPFQLRWLAFRAAPKMHSYRQRATSTLPIWSDAYVARVERGFGLYLAVMAASGRPPTIDPEGVDHFIADRREHGAAPLSLVSYVEEIAAAAGVVMPDQKMAVAPCGRRAAEDIR